MREPALDAHAVDPQLVACRDNPHQDCVAGGAADDDARCAVDAQGSDDVLGATLATPSRDVGRVAPEDVGEQTADRVPVDVGHVTLLRIARS